MTELFNEKYYEHLTNDDLANERWKPIEGYEGLYEISTCGRVKSLARTKLGNGGSILEVNERILKPTINRNGYAIIHLCLNCKSKTTTVHKLVASHYCYNDDPSSKTVINHINANKLDNRACNLEFCTPKHNTNEAWRLGLCEGVRESIKKRARQLGLNSAGENHGRCKLSDIEVTEIRNLYALGGTTQKELSEIYDVGRPYISHIINNKYRTRPTPAVH